MLILLTLCLCTAIAQEPSPGIIHPGDVVFEQPFQDISPPLMNDYRYSKILMQDSRGFLWLAYHGSLYRYDGYELKDFMKTPLGQGDLRGNIIACMEEDAVGNFWIGSHMKIGVYRYDPRKGKFDRFPRPGRNDPVDISEAESWSISAGADGKVWISTRGYGPGRGLYMYDYETDSVTSFRHDPDDPNSIPRDAIAKVHVDKHKNIWIKFPGLGRDNMKSGLCRYDPGTGRFTEFRLSGKDLRDSTMSVRPEHEDREGNIYMNTALKNDEKNDFRSFVRVSSHPDKLEYDSLSGIGYFLDYEVYPLKWYGRQLTLDKTEKVWANAGLYGAARYDPQTSITEYFKSYETRQGANYFLGNILCDSSGIIWHSYEQGLKQYVPWKRKFSVYASSSIPEQISRPVDISAVFEDQDGTLWMGMNEYLVKYDPESSRHQIFTLPRFNFNIPNRMMMIKRGGPNLLYIGAVNCFYTFNTDTYDYEVIEYPEMRSRHTGAIKSHEILVQDESVIWMGCNPGFLKVDVTKKTSEYLYIGIDRDSPFMSGNTYGIVKDKYGYLWLGTMSGLNRFDPLSGENVKISHDPNNPVGLAAPWISDLELDHNGNLWISYASNGISMLDARFITAVEPDPDSLKFVHFSKEDGLPDLFVSNMVVDNSGKIWFSSGKGISVLDPPTNKIITYDDRDGINIPSFINDFWINPVSGSIFIGGKNGMVSFVPEEMPRNTYVPPIVFTGLQVNNREVIASDTSVLKSAITYTEQLELSYQENFLLLEFAALDFTHPERNEYKYFMEGVDRDTIYAGTNRTAEYRNLAPGRYTFWATGSNSDGVWNTDGIRMEILIRPPWYRSTAANSGYIFLGILAVLLFVRLRTERLRKEQLRLRIEVDRQTKQLRKKNEQILEMERLKTKFFADISHEIRTPVSLISGPLENLISSERRDPKEAEWLKVIRRNSKRLIMLVNQLLDISKLDTGHTKLIFQEYRIFDHLRVLLSEYSSLADSRNIELVSEIPVDDFLCLYDKEKLEKIITNLLGNAFKFTHENGRVLCRAKVFTPAAQPGTKWLRIMVADDGPGIPLDEQERIFERFYRSEQVSDEGTGGTGIGLALTNDLVRLMHGDIYLRSSAGKGSVFIVSIPLGTEHLSQDEYSIMDGIPEQQIETPEPAAEELRPDTGISALDLELLLVEDNKDLRMFIHESLSADYLITEAENGAIGLDIAREKLPDIIITDVMMPDMDGMELCKHLKNDERTSHIPVIMLTARSTRKDKISGLDLGADAYIFKPFNMEELKAWIRNLLAQREKLKKKYAGMIGLDIDELKVTSLDEIFLKKTLQTITENLDDFSFNVGVLQDKLAISRGHLHRKVKALTGESPVDLIRIMRLKAAASFLKLGTMNVTEAALSVGFSNQSYFAKCFREYFGQTPASYRKSASSS